MRGWLAAAVGLAPALTACGLLLGIEDRTADKVTAEEVEDAGTRLDARPTIDADAPAKDGSLPGFCALRTPAPAFCVDFEGATKVDESFSELRITGGATFSLVADPARGSVASLKMPATTPAGVENGACLVAILPGNKTKVTLDLDLNLVSPGDGAESLDLFRVGESEAASNVAVELHADLAIAVDEDLASGGSKVTDLGVTLPPGWTHVRVEYVVGSTDAQLTATFDGEGSTNVRIAPGAFRQPQLVLQLGDCAAGTSSRWEMRYDNIVVTTE